MKGFKKKDSKKETSSIGHKEEMKVGSNVAVIGGGVVGAELSHKLVDEGYEVTIIEMLPEMCNNLEPMHKELLETFLQKNATICLNTKVN